MTRGSSRIRRDSAIFAVIVISIASAVSFSLLSSSEGFVGEAETGGTVVVGREVSADVAWRPAQTKHPSAADRRRMQSSIYNPDAALVSQLEKLRALSDRSNAYATCVLAWALDLCSRGPERIPVGEFSNVDLRALGEDGVTRIASSIESQEKYEMVCSGLVAEDLSDMNERLLQSARMGHVRSMSRFAQLPRRPDGTPGGTSDSFPVAYRDSAERMLNRAAEAGDPDAIRGIYNAYSGGRISGEHGNIDVSIDMAKSLAALRVISLNADPQEKIELEQGIEQALAGMDRIERSRFDYYASVYRRASAKAPKAATGLHGAADDFPEHVCDRGFSAVP